MAPSLPRRRQRGLRIEEFQGEVLVYDLGRHRAHCLNGLAAQVWQHCDGATSIAEIARHVAPPGSAPDEDLVWRALVALDDAKLLETPLERTDESRRRLLAQAGWAAGIALVTSITVPEPAFAASGPTGPTGAFEFTRP
jgi:hypothetical protein